MPAENGPGVENGPAPYMKSSYMVACFYSNYVHYHTICNNITMHMAFFFLI